MKRAALLLLFSLCSCVTSLELLGPPVPDAGATDGGPADSGTTLALAVTLNVGSAQTCVTRSTGALYCFGDNGTGQLGLGDTAQHFGPAFVDGGPLGWVSSAIGERHGCGLKTDGSAFCWGENTRGALGTGETGAHLTPFKVLDGPYRQLSAGDGYSCALTAAGSILCWGDNSEGQLGQPDTGAPPGFSATPLKVGGAQYRQVAAGQGHACGLVVDGGLECWGRNTEGQVGSGSPLGNVRGPMLALNGPWLSVSATQGSTCAIRTDGTLWCWGEGPSLFSRVPVQVGSATDWTQVSVNEFHHCGRRGAALYCWGRGIEGQLGQGDNNPQPAPTQIAGSWSTVATSRFHTCGIQSDGRLYCWGKNDVDELGQGDNVRRSIPTLVPLP